MRISVAMCTYNGERFIRDELGSFLTQTRLPDELVVSDDRSTDATVEIVEEFARHAPFEVKLSVSPVNLKYPKNFERAIGLTRGELVVPADWDDVWLPQKLARLEEAAADPEVGLVFSDAHLVDAELRPLGRTLWQARGLRSGHSTRLSIEDLFHGNLKATYATTMAFKATFKRAVLPLPAQWHADDTRVGMAPDSWIAVIIAALARVALVNEPLLNYRQHGTNESGVGASDAVGRVRASQSNEAATFLERAARWDLAAARLAQLPAADPRVREFVREAGLHNRARAAAAQNGARRLPLVAQEVMNGRYRRYSKGWRSAAADLARAL